MAKSLTVASKFSEEENTQIEIFAEIHGMTKSQVVHDLVMKGMREHPTTNGLQTVGFRFKENFAFFWEGITYRGTLNGNDASIKFGGEWRNYKLDELPVDIVD